MVNKSVRCGQRTGNSVSSNLENRFYSRHGGVSCAVYNAHIDENKREEFIKRKLRVLNDGRDNTFYEEKDTTMLHLYTTNHSAFDNDILFSLNKHKRWMLASYVEGEIENLKNEDFRVVVWERKLPMTPYSRIQPYSLISKSWNDCIRYTDNKTIMTSASCGTAASHFTDLRRKCMAGGKMENNKSVRKRKNRNRHFRGIQRKSELANCQMTKTDNSQTYTAHGLMAGEDNGDIPEIRYQICEPSKCTSRLALERSSSCRWQGIRNRGDRFRWGWPSDDNKALKKQKGCVSKSESKWYLQSWGPLEDKKFRKEFDEWTSPERWNSIRCCHGKMYTEVCHNGQRYTNDSYLYKEDLYPNHVKSEIRAYMCSNDNDRLSDTYIVMDKGKENIEVDILDLIEYTKQKKKSVKRKRKTVEENQSHNSKKGQAILHVEEKNTKMTTLSEYNTQKNVMEQNELESSSNTFDISFNIQHCLFRKKDIQKFCMKNSDCMISNSTIPQKLLLPIYKHPKHEFPYFEMPYLIVEETLSSLCSFSEEAIGTYRLRIHSERDDICLKNATESLRTFILQDEFLIFSVQEIINHIKKSCEIQYASYLPEKENEDGEHDDGYSTLEGLWDCMPTVRYKVKTVKQVASEVLYSQRTQMKESKYIFEEQVRPTWRKRECGVCYAIFDEYPELEGTILLPCLHIFCNTCLGHYVTERIRNGAWHIQCMEYKCTTQIDDISVLSLISSKLFNQWIERRHENAVVKTGKWKYCANNKCNRVVSVENYDLELASHLQRMSVKCHCKQEFCFKCQAPPHWPSTCKQMEFYKKLLEQNGELVKTAEQKSYFVNVKSCPKCKEKIEKNGGCSSMTCKCSHIFCWICLRPHSEHLRNGLWKCGPPVSEQTVELDNLKIANLPSICYKKSLIHRKAWMNMSEYIEREIYRSCCANKEFKRSYTERTIFFYQQIKHFDEVKEVHKLVENVYCSLSNSTKKVRARHRIQDDEDRIYFIANRIIELLQTIPRSDVNQRIQKLRNILQKNVKVLVSKANYIQRTSRQLELGQQKISLTYRYT